MTDPSPDADGTLSPLAAHLRTVVTSSPRQRIELDVLYRGAVEFDRSLASAPHAAAELLTALGALGDAGVLVLPRGHAHYDRRSSPALPKWVKRVTADKPLAPARPARVWPSALQPAAAVARQPEEFAVLEVVAGFLRDGGAARISVPSRERSLELFGDEKRLDRLRSSTLFRTGALTLGLLRCHDVPMPFASQWVDGRRDGPVTLLVAENHHTYESLLTASRAQAAAGGPARHVGYGAGQQFCSSIGSLTLLRPVPERIVYFGDIDLRGLEIPALASRNARERGLPAVCPAELLYAALFEHGVSGPGGRVAEDVAALAAQWLPAAQVDKASALLTAGERLAQEAIGLERLLASPQWLGEL